MVADFQDRGGLEQVSGYQLALGAFLHVTRQQEGGGLIVDSQHQGVVIFGFDIGDIVGPGGEDGDGGAPKRESLVPSHLADPHTITEGSSADVLPFRTFGDSPGPEFGGVEVPQDGRHAAHVILVRVTHDDNIEVASAAGVASVLLEDGEGITWERFERGLALWRRAR